jgi:hypothetical protein
MKMWTYESRTAPFVEVFRRTATKAGYDVSIIAPGAEPPRYTRFRAAYRHLSVNSEGFELACYRRWFEIAERVAPDDHFVHADSDLIVQTGFAALPAELRDSGALVASIGATDDVPEQQINAGYSIWTGRRLHDFCDYLIARYEAGTEGLEALRDRWIAEGNPRAAISDMVLLYLWVAEAGIPFVNSNRVIDGHYIDHTFFMPGCLGTQFRMALGRKALTFRPDGFWLTTTAGEPVRPVSLHLVGRCKIMAEAIEAGDSRGLALKSAYILGGRAGRAALGKLGIKV